MARVTIRRWTLLSVFALHFSPSAHGQTPVVPGERQALADAWWTGPLLAASASTLPRGHFLIEPYLYDSIVYGHFDSRGDLQRVPRERDASTRLSGLQLGKSPGAVPAAIETRSGPSEACFLAPAIEYSWSARVGVIVGARFLAAGRNATATVTPVAALNVVY